MDRKIMAKKYDFVIVGAGLYGATFAFAAHRKGKKCLVLDKRMHAGGNIYCENIEGINVHRYGPHVFHTSDREVWEFVTSLLPFNHYINCPLAKAADGRLYNLPFNMNTFNQLWGVTTPEEASLKLDEERYKALEEMKLSSINEAHNLEEHALTLVGREIYEKLIKGYTEKQWGKHCVELPSSILLRIPMRMTFNNNYFNDIYQGVPQEGYNKLIDSLLEDIEVRLNTDFFEAQDYYKAIANKVLYTGKIDEFYRYCYGKLEYRTLRFETELFDTPNYQGNAVVNYTSIDVPYTRVIEHKHFESFGEEVYLNPKTVISKEYPAEWREGLEAFYPVNTDRNQELYDKYKQLANNEENVIFGGRLAEFKYLNMDEIIRKALSEAERACNK